MLHQFVEPNTKIFNACNLFTITSDYWGRVPMSFLLGNAMLLLQSHLQPIIGNVLSIGGILYSYYPS
jgi:hypothetical protein